jgi:hypothetical protein
MTLQERRNLAIEDCALNIMGLVRVLSKPCRAHLCATEFEDLFAETQRVLDGEVRKLRSLQFDPNTPYDVSDNGGNRIICVATRERLKQEFPHWIGGPYGAPSWEALYLHYDNVRYMCVTVDKIEVPLWFQQKTPLDVCGVRTVQ